MNQYQNNRKNLSNLMEHASMLLLDSGKAPHKTTDQYYSYTVHKNFFYLTGIKEEECQLLLLKDGEKAHEYLFIPETTEHMRLWVGEKISKEVASKTSGIDVKNIFYTKQFIGFINRIMSYTRGNNVTTPTYLYLDLLRVKPDVEPISYTQFKDILNIYKELQVKNANQHLSYLRMFKSKEEIKDLQKAIDITNEGIKRIMNEVGHRYYENQVEADFDHELALNGAKTKGFNTIMASGVNATVLHYEDNDDKLDKDDLLLVDLGAEYNNYSADISRTFPINGTFTNRQKQIYNIVLKANVETIKMLKPGVTWAEFNTYAKNILIEECKNIGLIKDDNEITKYYYHSIGHFLGLDTHDIGHYKLPLKEGMVITVEPGLYIKEEGIGIRIEDDILITKNGHRNLSKDIIKEVDDIETFMNK